MDTERVVSKFSALRAFQKEGLLTDVVLKCQGGEVKAHRVVLMANHTFFKAALTSTMKEGVEGVIKFLTFPMKAVDALVCYLYGEKLSAENLDVDVLPDVVALAHLTMTDELFHSAWKIMMRNIGEGNILRVWEMAGIYDKKECLYNYILKYYSVVKRNKYKIFLQLNEQQLLDFMRFSVCQKPMINLSEMIMVWANADEKKKDLATRLICRYVDNVMFILTDGED